MSNEMTINENDLYIEETFTDMECGAIKRFLPVDKYTRPDLTRKVKFVAVASIMTPRGPMPINAPIEGADCLEDAIMKFKDTVDNHIKQLIKQAQEYEREQRSQIITPAQAGVGSGLTIIK